MIQRKAVVGVLACTFMMSACQDATESENNETSRPVKTLVVGGPAGNNYRNFPGRIESANKAELAFRMGGTITELLVQEGSPVEQNQVIARLDQEDFKIALADRKAKWDRAEKDFSRGKELVESGAISRRDFDQLESNFKTADAALKQAELDLEHASLKAPFSGQIAQRHVDGFEEVKAGEAVFSIIDRSALEVQIDVPENIIRQIPNPENDVVDQKRVNAWAAFDLAPGRRMPLTFKEAATRADDQTQTFAVTFTLEPPSDVMVLPGMTANVSIDFSSIGQIGRAHV